MRFGLLLACVGIIVVPAGCSTSTVGSPRPNDSAEPARDHRAELSADERAALEYFDELRPMDPCALLDGATVDRWVGRRTSAQGTASLRVSLLSTHRSGRR